MAAAAAPERVGLRPLARRGLLPGGLELGNSEQGTPIWICSGLIRPWKQAWPDFHWLGA